jgi:hypothetical protein
MLATIEHARRLLLGPDRPKPAGVDVDPPLRWKGAGRTLSRSEGSAMAAAGQASSFRPPLIETPPVSFSCTSGPLLLSKGTATTPGGGLATGDRANKPDDPASRFSDSMERSAPSSLAALLRLQRLRMKAGVAAILATAAADKAVGPALELAAALDAAKRHRPDSPLRVVRGAHNRGARLAPFAGGRRPK